MLTSMFIGLSGMNAYSNGLQGVSNNITNLNTPGYKGELLVFRDLYGADGSLGLGTSEGSGHGVSLALSTTNFQQGELRQSDNDLDLAVDGDGFLVLEKDGQYFYTRTGNFEVNDEGFIVLSGTDYKLTLIGTNGKASPVSIDSHRTSFPEATTRITFADNLSSTATSYTIADVEVFNSNGVSSEWSVAFSRAETDSTGEWTVAVTDQAGNEVGSQKLSFSESAPTEETRELTFTDADNGYSIVLDFSENVTSFSSGEVSTLRTDVVDGFGIGDIVSVRVNDAGALEIQYSNEQTKELGDVTLAEVEDLQSLQQRDGGVFHNPDSGNVQFLTSESDRVGQVLSNRIEASNVELSSEFGNLILVQRGYQASSQVVSVSNEMIQQLFQTRGQ